MTLEGTLYVRRDTISHRKTAQRVIDESGSKEDTVLTVVSIAGVMAPIDALEQFEADWRPVLRHFCVSELHMKDLAHFRGEYGGGPKTRGERS